MDIPGLSMRMAQSNLLTDVGTAMLAKTMEQADSVSAAMTEMLDASAMELSVNPGVAPILTSVCNGIHTVRKQPFGAAFFYFRHILSELMTIF